MKFGSIKDERNLKIVKYINRIRSASDVVRSENDKLLTTVVFKRLDGRRSMTKPTKRCKDVVVGELSRIGIQKAGNGSKRAKEMGGGT